MLATAIVLSAASAADLAGSIRTIRQVGPDGKGSREAAAAWKELARADAGRLPELLAGMDGANAVARNWLRSAVEEVLERARRESQSLPTAELEAFLRDPRHDPQARRLAYELIAEKDNAARDRLLPDMLDDPSPELRRDAVGRVLDQADALFTKGKKEESLRLYEQGLSSARDRKQVKKATDRLQELGHPVDLARYWGFVLDWKLVGPFPNENEKGAETVYPPESGIDPAAEYEGKGGKVGWKNYVSKDANGIVDLGVGVGKHAHAVGYALAEFTSAEDRDVEVRLGCFTAFKLWVNGELVLDRGDAYTGMRPDHYVAKVHLKKGANAILLKAIQEDPKAVGMPMEWKFQLRVCDETGKAILSTTRPAAPAGDKKA
jgi:hypothetical protein